MKAGDLKNPPLQKKENMKMADEKKLKMMLQQPNEIKLLDGKIYKIPVLSFPDALEMSDKISMVNTIPAVAITDKEQRENLLDILETIFSYNNPEITRKRLSGKPALLDLSHIREIIAIALDISGLKKSSPLPEMPNL